MSVSENLHIRTVPQPRAMLELIKPITWFPPVWAYLCGVVSSGGEIVPVWPLVLLGMVLAGPVARLAGGHAAIGRAGGRAPGLADLRATTRHVQRAS